MKFRLGDVLIVDGKHGSVFVSRRSQLSGKLHTVCMNGPTSTMLAEWFVKRLGGMDTELIQDTFPTLSSAEREFLLTGITEEEWKATFSDDEEEEERGE